jgi:hypothetical protein
MFRSPASRALRHETKLLRLGALGRIGHEERTVDALKGAANACGIVEVRRDELDVRQCLGRLIRVFADHGADANVASRQPL